MLKLSATGFDLAAHWMDTVALVYNKPKVVAAGVTMPDFASVISDKVKVSKK